MFHERRWLGAREEVLHFDIKIAGDDWEVTLMRLQDPIE